MPQPLLLGVSARIHHPTGPVLDLGGVYLKTLHYLEQSVAHWVMSKDVLVVMIPAIESEGMIARSDMSLAAYAELLDGLVLQGGSDLAPETYGESPLAPEWSGDRVRDRYEIDLFEEFIALRKPVLGICRGCQLLNVALGGTLIQHLPDDVGHGDHRRRLGSFEDADHDVRLAPGSLAARACGELVHGTKSHHHQGVDRLGDGLAASGWSVMDDLVEAIEGPGARWALGVQWHPEVDPGSGVVAALVRAAAGAADDGAPDPLHVRARR
jgi:putative glutamine amidotransferase